MKRQGKADRIGEILDEIYPETPIPLDHTDPYTLLVAVAGAACAAGTTSKHSRDRGERLYRSKCAACHPRPDPSR